MFNLVMCLLNIRHAVLLLYHKRYVEFDEEWEQIYCQIFEAYMNRTDFQQLVSISFKRQMKADVVFKKKGDEVTSLCCLVSGRIAVVRDDVSNVRGSQIYSPSKSNLSVTEEEKQECKKNRS